MKKRPPFVLIKSVADLMGYFSMCRRKNWRWKNGEVATYSSHGFDYCVSEISGKGEIYLSFEPDFGITRKISPKDNILSAQEAIDKLKQEERYPQAYRFIKNLYKKRFTKAALSYASFLLFLGISGAYENIWGILFLIIALISGGIMFSHMVKMIAEDVAEEIKKIL